jgi:hypothetical protein
MKQTLHSHFTTLGLTSGASWNEVKEAYKTLIKGCHPDTLGGEVSHTALFEEQAKALNEAYNHLKAHFAQSRAERLSVALKRVAKTARWDINKEAYTHQCVQRKKSRRAKGVVQRLIDTLHSALFT